MKGIADTGFLVAFVSEADQYHRWAVQAAPSVDRPLLTCEPVLAETAFHLGNADTVFALIKTGLVIPKFDLGTNLDRLADLATRYQDRHPDLADLCLIRMSELFPHHSVVTTDVADFSIYRRGRRDVIPLIHPPKRHRHRS